MLDAIISYKSYKSRAEKQSFFIRQLAVMLGAGIDASEALEILNESKKEQKLKWFEYLTKYQLYKKKGSESIFEKSPEWFKNLLAYIVANGVVGKDVTEIIHHIADEQENMENMKRRVTSVMTYPIFVLCVAAMILGMIIVFVIPTFVEMFNSFGTDLPGPTRDLIKYAMFLTKNIFWIFLVIAVIFQLMRTKVVRDVVLFIISLTEPGDMITTFSIIIFSRCLSIMLYLKAPLDQALETAVNAVPNFIHARKFRTAVSRINDSSSLAEALESTGFYSPVTIRILKAGEKSGSIEVTLKELARYQEKDLEAHFEVAIKTLGISALLGLSIIIGFIVIALYLPIFQMGGILG